MTKHPISRTKKGILKYFSGVCLSFAVFIACGPTEHLKEVNLTSLKDRSILEESKQEQARQEQACLLPLSKFRIVFQGAKLEFIDNQLHVASLPRKWAYAAIASLEGLPVAQGSVTIKIRAEVLEGKMAFGVLSKDQKAFIIEKALQTGTELLELQLQIPAIEEASKLVIRTWADDGQVSKAIIESVTIHSEKYTSNAGSKSVIEQPYIYASRFPDQASVLLHHLIIKDYPQIEDENLSDWEKINLLRQWACENIDFEAEISKVVDAPSSPYHYYMWTAPEIFAFFLEDKGGTWCAGFAHALSTLLRMYGYRSYQIDMGAQNTGMTHVVTIVEIEFEGRNIWTVQDVYFDETIIDTLGNPYGFFDLLRLLKQRKHHLVKTKIGSSGQHDMFVAPELVPMIRESGFSWYFYDLPEIPEPVKILPDGRYKYKVKPRLKNLLQHPTSGKPLLQWLESEGYPPNMLYFYLYTFAIYGTDSSAADRAALLDRVRSVINH